ncbi:sigma-70 family RNA polymerase sigma factor [Apibacter muscae]|uniref:Sigma-70 family RNA polymerase sigma factor n=1 Tax=Apibacter muscae TaxID=2509004 RepID=A0A563DIG3_9FLAO|nr:sigma-70 family RNA polymerase sigma factor [Apibacter muscae]TWP29879.1 sigma-70 family RNA polymerase sigma factor [Apibacter muscae]
MELYDLIEKAKTSKQQAQSRLVNLFWDDVKRYIYSLVKDENNAEELTIETFTKVLQKLNLYNIDFDFKTWILSIAHNTCIDFLRKNNKILSNFSTDNYHDIKDSDPSPEQLFINKQNVETVQKMLNKLPEKYSILIQLRYLDEKKLNEIVNDTGLTLANVKVSLMRAKKLLFEMKNQNL